MTVNMSYCRYHNTLLALKECWANWTDATDLSVEEAKARRELIDLAREIVEYEDGEGEDWMEEDEEEDDEIDQMDHEAKAWAQRVRAGR
jgi:hypothetical protein